MSSKLCDIQVTSIESTLDFCARHNLHTAFIQRWRAMTEVHTFAIYDVHVAYTSLPLLPSLLIS